MNFSCIEFLYWNEIYPPNFENLFGQRLIHIAFHVIALDRLARDEAS